MTVTDNAKVTSQLAPQDMFKLRDIEDINLRLRSHERLYLCIFVSNCGYLFYCSFLARMLRHIIPLLLWRFNMLIAFFMLFFRSVFVNRLISELRMHSVRKWVEVKIDTRKDYNWGLHPPCSLQLINLGINIWFTNQCKLAVIGSEHIFEKQQYRRMHTKEAENP